MTTEDPKIESWLKLRLLIKELVALKYEHPRIGFDSEHPEMVVLYWNDCGNDGDELDEIVYRWNGTDWVKYEEL